MLYPRKLVILNGRTFAVMSCINQCSTPKTRDFKWTHICQMSALINALPRKLVILNGRTFAECLTLINALPSKTRDIKWTHICLNVSINQCSTQKTRDIKWTHISVMSCLINALPRKLVILNGRTFA